MFAVGSIQCCHVAIIVLGFHAVRFTATMTGQVKKPFGGVAISSCARYMPISAKPDDYTKELRCKRCRGREAKLDSAARALPC